MCAEAPASLIRNDAPSHPAGWVVFLLSWVVGIAAGVAMGWPGADRGFIAGLVAAALLVIDAAYARRIVRPGPFFCLSPRSSA